MFDLEPPDELALVAETARKFAETELLPALRDAELERAPSAGVQSAYEEIGLGGLELPEAFGGAGLGSVARVLVNEELAAADPGAAIALDRLGIALYPLVDAGAESVLESLASASGRTSLVAQEDADLRIEGDRLHGEIAWVPADSAERCVVLMHDEALLVESGLVSTPLRGAGLRAAGASALRFDGAPVAERFGDRESCTRARARARLYVASLLLGVMRNTCDFSREYALERQAFGRPIAHHQALAFLITDMQMALDGARLLVHEAAWRLDERLPCAGEAAAAYAQCIEAARLIGPNGVQILGGHGFMADYPMEKTMREARALGLLLGGFDAAVEEAGQALCAGTLPLELSVMEGR